MFSGGSFLDLDIKEVRHEEDCFIIVLWFLSRLLNMSAIVPRVRVIVIMTTRPFQALDMEEMGCSIVLPLNINFIAVTTMPVLILGIEEV